jgi:hypothetical protein
MAVTRFSQLAIAPAERGRRQAVRWRCIFFTVGPTQSHSRQRRSGRPPVQTDGRLPARALHCCAYAHCADRGAQFLAPCSEKDSQDRHINMTNGSHEQITLFAAARQCTRRFGQRKKKQKRAWQAARFRTAVCAPCHYLRLSRDCSFRRAPSNAKTRRVNVRATVNILHGNYRISAQSLTIYGSARFGPCTALSREVYGARWTFIPGLSNAYERKPSGSNDGSSTHRQMRDARRDACMTWHPLLPSPQPCSRRA